MTNTLQGTVNGLALFQDELKYFPKEHIIPYRGIGRYPEHSTFKIILIPYRNNHVYNATRILVNSPC